MRPVLVLAVWCLLIVAGHLVGGQGQPLRHPSVPQRRRKEVGAAAGVRAGGCRQRADVGVGVFVAMGGTTRLAARRAHAPHAPLIDQWHLRAGAVLSGCRARSASAGR